MNNYKFIYAATYFIVLVFIVLVVKTIFLGGAKVVSLGSSSFLAGQVSQTLGPNNAGVLPVANSDYRYTTKYFDNNSWIMVNVIPLKGNGEDTTIIFQKDGGGYKKVLGPGSAFTNNQVLGLPPDISTYLNNNGAVYVPVAE